MVQNPPCWITRCTGHKKRTHASQAWLFSVLDVSVHYLQEISDVSVSGSLSHFGQILANSLKHNSSKVTFTKRKLYRNSICGNDSFPVPSWVYRHQWEKKNTNSYVSQPVSQQKFAAWENWDLWSYLNVLYSKYCGRFVFVLCSWALYL